MIAKTENPHGDNSPRKGMLNSAGETRQKISSAERWLLITEKAYLRAQRRGFVGGDPFADWAEAEQEVDGAYAADARSDFTRADAERVIDQVKRAFGGYGLGHLSLDNILEKHRDGLGRLAEHNRKLVESTSELALQQSALFQQAVTEAMDTLQSFSQGKVNADGFAKQAELSQRALENLLSYFKHLTQAAAEVSSSGKKGDTDK